MTLIPPDMRRELAISAILSCVLILLCGGIAVYVLSEPDLRLAVVFPKAVRMIQENYDGTVDWDRAFNMAQEAMFSQLDRYSGYIPKDEFSEMEEELSGGYSGIGVIVTKHELGLLILSVREGGPSAQAGLLSGDIIERIDSLDIAPMSAEMASRYLRGSDASSVRLLVLRPASRDTLTVTVKRGRVELEHIPYAGFTADSVMYIRVLDFEAGTSNDLRLAIDSLLAKPGMKAQGLILDLRGNPGGLFEEAIATANLFLKKDQFIVGTASRSRWEEEKYYATGSDITGGLPMAVLVDRGSASSAEIVSGALRQLGRSILIGDTTFGKGLVQGYSRYPDGSGIKLTVSRYFLSRNLFLNRLDSAHSDTGNGLIPDYFVSYPDRSPFLMELEGSMLLEEFAYQHQDEIIAGVPSFGPESTWAAQFSIYAQHEKFNYMSEHTEDAELLLKIAQEEHASQPLLDEAVRLLKLSQADDWHQFIVNRDHIETELRRLALDRKFGSYRAYAEAVVNHRSDIKLAARLLKGKQT